MRRTQLYLDDPLWKLLHLRARRERTTISELVRKAVRERYMGNLEERGKAMQALVGIRKDETGGADSERYIRSLRHGSRLGRLATR